MKRKLTILCDLDAIVVDLLKKWMEHYNRDYSDKLTRHDWVVHWGADKVAPKAGKKIFDYLYSTNFFLDLEPLEGAPGALEALHDDGHKIVIVTAHSFPGTSASDKIAWVRKHLPFIGKRNVMLGHQKHLMKGHIFIDDSPDNIKEYRREWGTSAKIMTIAYPYNECVKDLVDVYAEGYNDTSKAWGTLYRAIDQLSEASEAA